jgi:hypothetical protein
MRSSVVVAVGVCVVRAAFAADTVPPDFARRFGELAARAEQALQAQGPDAAIKIYEDALLGPLGEYGRISLRLGQLYQDQKRYAEAAWYFRSCQEDERVDAVDRQVMCAEGLSAVTAPLVIEGLPPRTRVAVIEPARFNGLWAQGMRLPLGPARVGVEAPGRQRAETAITIVPPETRWEAVIGPPLDDASPDLGADAAAEAPEDAPSRWPIYTAGGVGLGLVAGGLYLGFTDRGDLADVRSRQAGGRCGADNCRGDLNDLHGRARLADGMWIGGAALVASSALAWYLLDHVNWGAF